MIRHNQTEIFERDFISRFNEPIYDTTLLPIIIEPSSDFLPRVTNLTTFAFDVHGIDFPAVPVTK